ncbi:putative dual specificity protein phosphatase or MAP kinase phosphatase [Trypanosoma grayi]|uniref:putative dual specificity protein phosphatase or MAP kinase phosphatase n=1 Tax=Trypanosoma grayi TaxID=71804 RepID=UPI0004F47C5E|nr:putative dual specificity protein phosphatase or MAP kinase phosphatase [Trypanosoma grayi]KEG14707.1 putative dual specificity protein phosphatase or MAP kinase phosphatase [Trypanosoma grayi]
MSRCREKIAKNRLPAFNLELVRQQSEVIMKGEGESVCNAAMCHPISIINDMLCIGSWRDAADEELLRQHHITHVLNVARELIPEEELHRMESINFVKSKCIPLSDSLNEELKLHFEEAFEFIRNATRNGRVLVHCRRGISRSAAIVIAYMMASEGQSFRTAFDTVYQKRPCISLNLAFIQGLEEYEAHLRSLHQCNCIEYDKANIERDKCCDVRRVKEAVLSEPQSAQLDVQCGFKEWVV